MSILQFIVDMKWALLALVLAAGLAYAIRRMSDDTRHAFRTALVTRGLKVGLPGGIDVDWSAAPPPSEEAVSRAVAPDEQLAVEAQPSDTETTEELVQQIRRDAVEQVMREAAEWGWSMARAGAPIAPVPQITWNGDKPEINNGFTPMELALLRMNSSPRGRLSGYFQGPVTVAPAPRSSGYVPPPTGARGGAAAPADS